MNRATILDMLAADGLTTAHPIADIVDSITYGLSELDPKLTWSEACDLADTWAFRVAA